MSTGIDSVDIDHKNLLNLVNELYDATLKGCVDNDLLGSILLRLIDYTILHFKREEDIWEAGNYAYLLQHKEEHYSLILELAAFKRAFDDKETTINDEVLEFLKNWLMTHTINSDCVAAKTISKVN